jgi:hypothetical protein
LGAQTAKEQPGTASNNSEIIAAAAPKVSVSAAKLVLLAVIFSH